ncbi:TIR domain-containing protein [Brevibacillus laterosporus]|uniref:TIR domain-containing protein n=1 Tax=Brevibacillus laterosporus TaxID=1465 RepID=UPI000EB4D80D|nr:TIR domain-containing protein [Brevibacillus laterosporus]AYK05277.1 TIR domain-containing protein [Brevibacillus laterosporus]
MPALRTYNIFISHAWTYNDDYYRLEEMLNKANNFSWKNYSVPEHDSLDTATNQELETALQNQIRPTSIVLVLCGMYVNHRRWIQKEIDIAVEMNKPIVGIRPWGQQRIPQEIQDVAKEIVGWNTDSIVSAIRRNAL